MIFPDHRSFERPQENPGFPGGRSSVDVAAPYQGGGWFSDNPAERAYEPRPARVSSRPAPAKHTAKRRGARTLVGIVSISVGLGFCIDGTAVTLAPRMPGVGLLLFWVAMLLPFAVFAAVLLASEPSRVVREFTVAVVGLYPAVLYRMTSPLVLGGFDEHIHERTLLDLLRGAGLFAPNPELPVSTHYPGMELFTGMMVRLTGMPVMLAMAVVVLLCRLLLVLTIYHSALTVNPSHRGASLVVLLYAASPQFYFFNSQFAYQTMALTLGLGGLLLLRRAQLAEGAAARRLCGLAILALVATVVTHHVTSWIVFGFLVIWTALAPRGQRKILACAALAMGISVAIWTAAVFSQLAVYLGPIFAAALRELKAFFGAAAPPASVLSGSPVAASPEWERLILIFYSLTCGCAALVCGWTLLLRAFHQKSRMLGFLAALCLVYPVTLAAHFIPTAAALGDRASTFLFLPLALSCSLLLRRTRGGTRRAVRRASPVALMSWIALLLITYMGGAMLGAGPNWEILPGPYLVSAEARTQDPETLAAVRWAAAHLPAGSRIAADRVPADLLAGQDQLWPVTSREHGLAAAWLYFPATWGPQQAVIVKRLHIRYLYVDQRLANSLPRDGYYFYPGEALKPRRITVVDLTKFSHVHGLRPVYRHGPVTIYDTAGLGVTPVRSGFVGEHPMGLGTLGDGLLGAAVMAALILLLRRRVGWLRSVARESGLAGGGVAVMATLILVGGVLFGFRITPGAAFTVGAVLTVLATLAITRRRMGGRLPLRLVRIALHPLVILGVLAATAGLVIGIHAAWIPDVTSVNAILHAVAMRGTSG